MARRSGFDPDLALRAEGILREFNLAGVLSAADVHIATTLGRLGGEDDQFVLLAAALAVRGTRAGSVVLDLAGAASSIAPGETLEADASAAESGALDQPAGALPWPEPEHWIRACAASPLVAGEHGPPGRPLRLVGGSIWLDRYFALEREVAEELLARAAAPEPELDQDRLRAGLDRLFPAAADADQRAAAGAAACSRLTVIAGGPGSGKTTTVARLLALLCDQPGSPPRIALAAPTGKAAARLTEAVQAAVAGFGEADRDRVGERTASTVHRLLGSLPGGRNRFRHDRTNRLPHDVVVIDETSMISLPLMARLLEAVRPTARLVLVGDPDQLASVEAGAVLGDLTAGTEARPEAGDGAGPRSRLADRVVRLNTSRRFTDRGEIAALAAAVLAGRVEETLQLLAAGGPGIGFVPASDAVPLPDSALAELRGDVVTAGSAMVEAALAGDGRGALEAAESHRVLCAHRTGPRGAVHFGDRISGWLATRADGPRRWVRGDLRHPGEPIMITENDVELDLFNGDTGVVIAADGELVAAFRRGPVIRLVPIARLPAVRTVHAMTVHKAQGSEFARVSVLLPPADSPLANRATLYTAITRAIRAVRLIGSVESVARSVAHPAARASGLGARLRVPPRTSQD